jgi:hypothetical protein
MIGAGEEWKGAIDRNLEEAQIVLLLISPDFLASAYCYDIETKRAVERHDRGEARVIPVILRPCDWHEAPFGKLQALPRDGKAVTSWRNRDEAWKDVAQGIRRAVVAINVNPRSTDRVGRYHVILLIHGIRTQADWGPMVKSKLEVPGQIEVIPIKYGFFDVFRFWFPLWTRRRPIERVYKQIRMALQVAREKDPHAMLSIIAHSFGTYIIGQILKRGFDLHIHRLILCGSVLPQDFPWEQYQGRFDREKVINECSNTDIWPVLAKSMSWGYGASGTHGFGAVLVKDRFHEGGHGQYFEPDFVDKSWEPFIRRGEYEGTKYEVQMPPTPWWVSVLGIM